MSWLQFFLVAAAIYDVGSKLTARQSLRSFLIPQTLMLLGALVCFLINMWGWL